jgi:hypothetical protein
MKERYLVFRRKSGIFFLEDRLRKKQNSLRTRHEETARRICHAKNEALRQPALNLQIARAYLVADDPNYVNRTWQSVMDAGAQINQSNPLLRWKSAMRETPFDSIRGLKLIETQPEHFLDALSTGRVSTNAFLRRLHNFALDMDWLPKAIIPRRQWPKIEFKNKRSITLEEHQKILRGENNPEWRAYYNLLWHIGGSQSDVARLRAEDIDWEMRVIGFNRMKKLTLRSRFSRFRPKKLSRWSCRKAWSSLGTRARQLPGLFDRATIQEKRCDTCCSERVVAEAGVVDNLADSGAQAPLIELERGFAWAIETQIWIHLHGGGPFLANSIIDRRACIPQHGW